MNEFRRCRLGYDTHTFEGAIQLTAVKTIIFHLVSLAIGSDRGDGSRLLAKVCYLGWIVFAIIVVYQLRCRSTLTRINLLLFVL